MKKIIFILLVLFLSIDSLKAQPEYISINQMGLSLVDPLTNPGMIKIHTRFMYATCNGFIHTDYTIVGNTINLNHCFWLTGFDCYGTATKDDFIQLPTNATGNWNLHATINCSGNQTVCDYSFIDHIVDYSFSMPIIGTVYYNYSLSYNSFENEKSAFQISPNPSTGAFNINFKEQQDNISVTITNVLGQVISTEKYAVVEQITTEITTEKGIYFVTIENENHEKKTVKIVKQ